MKIYLYLISVISIIGCTPKTYNFEKSSIIDAYQKKINSTAFLNSNSESLTYILSKDYVLDKKTSSDTAYDTLQITFDYKEEKVKINTKQIGAAKLDVPEKALKQVTNAIYYSYFFHLYDNTYLTSQLQLSPEFVYTPGVLNCFELKLENENIYFYLATSGFLISDIKMNDEWKVLIGEYHVKRDKKEKDIIKTWFPKIIIIKINNEDLFATLIEIDGKKVD